MSAAAFVTALLSLQFGSEAHELDFAVPYSSATKSPLRIYTENQHFLVAYAEGSIGAGDRLVGVNGKRLSSLTLQEALQGAPNTSAILPLVDQDDADDAELPPRLRGFVRIEILDPRSVLLRPLSEERRKLVSRQKIEQQKRQAEEEAARKKAEAKKAAATQAAAKVSAAKLAASQAKAKQAAAKAAAAAGAKKAAEAAKKKVIEQQAAKAAAAKSAILAKKKAVEMAKARAAAAAAKRASAAKGGSDAAGGRSSTPASGEPAVKTAADRAKIAAEIQKKAKEAADLKKAAAEKRKLSDEDKKKKEGEDKEIEERKARDKMIKEAAAKIETEKRINQMRRSAGESFWFTVTFSEPGSMGMALDAESEFAQISHTIPGTAAERLSERLMPGDRLVEINRKNCSGMDSRKATQAIGKAEWPRTLKFIRPESKASLMRKKALAEHEKSIAPQPRLVLSKPAILAGSYNLSWATWGGAIPKDCVALQIRLTVLDDMKEAIACSPPPKAKEGEVQPVYEFNSSGPLHMAFRGRCTFVEKARVVQKWGGSGLIVVNTADGPAYEMPASTGEADDIVSSVAMIDKIQGNGIIDLLDIVEIEGWLETDGDCKDEIVELSKDIGSIGPFQPWLNPPADNEDGIGELLVWNAKTLKTWRFEFMKAEFGAELSVNPRRLYVPPIAHQDACEVAKIGEEASNALVLAYRGTCSFGLKSKALQSRRSQGLILINKGDKGGQLFPMQVSEEEEKSIKIEAACVTSVTGEKLVNSLRNGALLYARFL